MVLVFGFANGDVAAEPEGSLPYRRAYEQMLASPTDVDAAYAFAEAAVEEGDVYGAVAALERILRLEPERPDIRIRLGELYAMVGATALARAYLEAGLASPAVPPFVRERAESLLAETARADTALDRRHVFSGIVSVGPRYETNANAGPDSVLVRVGGNDAFLADDGQPKADVSLAATADLRHRYRLDDQAGHRLETRLLGFVSRYADVVTSNASVIEIDSGPRVFLGDTGRLSLRPFAQAGFLALNDETYRWRVGAGLNARYAARANLLLEAELRYLAEDYRDTEDQPFGSLRSGQDLTFRPGLSYEIGPRTVVSGDLLAGHKNADAGFESFTDLGGGVSLTHVFADGVVDGWSLTGNAFYRRSAYSDPDPAVDPDVSRTDDRVDLGLSLGIPLTEALSLSLGVRHSENDSNLPNYEFDNTTVSVLTSFAF